MLIILKEACPRADLLQWAVLALSALLCLLAVCLGRDLHADGAATLRSSQVIQQTGTLGPDCRLILKNVVAIILHLTTK